MGGEQQLACACAAAVLAAALALCWFINAAWVSPAAARRRLRREGLDGPRPSFPLGNLAEMAAAAATTTTTTTSKTMMISSDIHAALFPYFARWRQAFGKVFVYWLGTQPFLYVAEPEFLKAATAGGKGKLWGKPDVFRRDRMPMFGRGLVMAEGEEWARHRNIIAPAFSATNLKAMMGLMQESTAKMLAEWDAMASSSDSSSVIVDVEKAVVRNAAEIIGRASFGLTTTTTTADDEDGDGVLVFRKLQAMQAMLFGQSNRLVGVPLARQLLHLRSTYQAWRLGREIDALLIHIIEDARRRQGQSSSSSKQHDHDLLSLLLAAGASDDDRRRLMSTRELVDECKTFFFGGHETTALAVSWTLLMLAAHPEWQEALREEVLAELREEEVLDDAAALGRLTKMGWVMNEVLRLYPPSPNVQRQALQDVEVVTKTKKTTMTVPRGTNMWVDVVAMHHDKALWGDDANEFRPERFASKGQHPFNKAAHFLPFGFGSRICVGRNLTAMEYRVVLAMVLRRFRLEVPPQYRHAPRIMLSLRPSNGIHLRLTPLISH
ncbi:hypothetical protein U9M48_021434 [Paspalum notatum var. saurae]|uniref:Cytochrome P450 n=1 Tax=Paspalum notatum var. saurae TaxID=547442 RepID=A0AAQ3WTZ6_PASNO